MAQTYSWVIEQEQVRQEKKNKKTEKWVIEQQSFLADRSNQRQELDKPPRRRTWDDLMGEYEVHAEKRSGPEAATRREEVERGKEKGKVIEEEIRRIQARVQKKKESERKRFAEEKWRATEAQKEIKKEERVRANVATTNIWRAYEAGWASIAASSEPITFRSIPWPLVSHPSSPADIIPAGIIAFLLSPLHSQDQTRKDRIRSALLRWHPDRFHKFLVKVVDEDKEKVQEGVGIVVRCLNELLERETRVSRRKSRHLCNADCR
jgi:hypothetical protein